MLKRKGYKMKNRKKIIWIFLGVMLLCAGCGKNETIVSPELYETILSQMKENSDIHSKMLIFPQSEVAIDYMKECNHVEQEGLFDGIYQLGIKCNYDDKTYEKEQQRLENIVVSYHNTQQVALSTTTESGYLAYITIYDGAGTYEYAMLDEKNTSIVYVFSQLGNIQDIIGEKYVVGKSDIEDKIIAPYNIYYFAEEEDGYSFVDD